MEDVEIEEADVTLVDELAADEWDLAMDGCAARNPWISVSR